MSKKKGIRVQYKIWMESAYGEGIMGDGKWRLLEMIRKKGSLSAAAEALGISYRKAWGDLKKAEILLDNKLLIRNRGGAFGGTSNLTEFGIKWLDQYMSFHRKMDKIFEREVEVFMNKFNKVNATLAHRD